MEKALINQVWNIEQEILDVVHQICIQQKIKYSLFYGTLIGAVRHKGFIPWDDDIDIVMPRKDYERFTKYWKNNPVEGYVFQDYNTDNDYTNNFIKIRKNNTTFLQTEQERDATYQKGVFIDIFPVDRVAPSCLGKKIQYVASAINLLYSRGYRSGSDGAIGFIETVLLLVPRKFQVSIRNISETVLKHWNKQSNTEFYCGCTIECCKKYYSANTFEKLKYIEFNKKKYLCVLNTDAVLRVEYDDYMQLPPEEERVWKHHPIVIDFEHNYEDL